MSTAMSMMLILIMIPIFISTMFVPYWTRRTESFGVSIPEDKYHLPELKRMRKHYATLSGILGAVSLVLLLLLSPGKSEDAIAVLYCILIFAYLIITFALYLYFHSQMKQLKQANKDWSQKAQLVVIDTSFYGRKLTYSNFWFSFAFIVSIGTIVFTILNYDKMPDQLPMQYNFNGEVTNWTEKTWRSALQMPIIQIYLTLMFIFINTIIAKAKQQVTAENTADSVNRNVIFRRRWSLYTIIMGNVMSLVFLMPQLTFVYDVDQRWFMYVPFGFALIAVAGAIILSITTGQGGSRLRSNGTGKNGEVIEREDDKYWKLGMFYFNPNDPAIFLEKRFGVGWTNNWGHPLSWLFIIVVIGLAFGLPLLFGG